MPISEAEILAITLRFLDAKFPAFLFPFITWFVGGVLLGITSKTKKRKLRAFVILFAMASGLMFFWWYIMPFIPSPTYSVWEFVRTFGVALKHAVLQTLGVNTVFWAIDLESASVGILVSVSKTKSKKWRSLAIVMATIFFVVLAVKILILVSPYFTGEPVE